MKELLKLYRNTVRKALCVSLGFCGLAVVSAVAAALVAAAGAVAVVVGACAVTWYALLWLFGAGA